MKLKELRNTMLLLLAAAIWGAGFVAQSVGAQYVGPFTFLALRSYLGGLVLLPLLFLNKKKITKDCLKAGAFIGLWLFMASYFQQVGVAYTTTAKAGFITTLYIVFVPLICLVLFKKKIELRIWGCILLVVAGLFLLNHMSFSFALGDTMVMICALLYSGHILVIDHYSQYDGVTISCIQFFTCAIISTLCMFIFETVSVTAIQSASISILYAGLFSSGMGYTLQVVGQKDVNPAIASIALSMESAFACIFGFIILKQALSVTELVGCVLMLSAIIISQLPKKN